MSKVDGSNYCYRPDMYVDVSSVQDKIEAIAACYQFENKNPYVTCALQRKRTLGAPLFVEAAESLMYVLDPINKRFGRECEVGRILRKL